MKAIDYALARQGIGCAWRGPQPSNATQITPENVADLVDGLPRIVYAPGETRMVDLAQLRTDFVDERVAEIARIAADEEQAQDKATIIADATVKQLITARPDQIDAYIEGNVTNLETAKDMLKLIAKAVSAIGKSEFMR